MNEKDKQEIIDKENGAGFSYNINIKGYTFILEKSFITFEMKVIENTRVCIIKYVYYDNADDLVDLMAKACSFWRGNKIQFFIYKEKDKPVSPIELFEYLGFSKKDKIMRKWRYHFIPRKSDKNPNKIHILCR